MRVGLPFLLLVGLHGGCGRNGLLDGGEPSPDLSLTAPPADLAATDLSIVDLSRPAPDLPPPVGCGGLQPGAPWPMRGYCPPHLGRSPVTGAQRASLRWAVVTGGPVLSSPAVAADGTVYVGSSDGPLYALQG